jgi:hypothetical protein
MPANYEHDGDVAFWHQTPVCCDAATDLTFLTLCNFKELDAAKTAQSATSALSASRRSLSHIGPTDV